MPADAHAHHDLSGELPGSPPALAASYIATIETPPLVMDVFWSEALARAGAPWQGYIDNLLLPGLPALWGHYLAEAKARGIPQALGLKAEGNQVWTVELTLLGNAEMQALNRECRGKDQPTDVLSFTLLADAEDRQAWLTLPEVSLGALVVSLDYAAEALWPGTRNFSAGHVLDLMALHRYVAERIVHGWLHLMGINHDTEREYNNVVAIQHRVLQASIPS